MIHAPGYVAPGHCVTAPTDVWRSAGDDRVSTVSCRRERESRSFEAQFEEEQQRPFRWKAVVKRSIVIVFAGVPSTWSPPRSSAVFHSWPNWSPLNLLWFIPAVLAEAGPLRLHLRAPAHRPAHQGLVPGGTAQLAGNAISLIVPGGQPRLAPPCSSGCWRSSGMDAADSVGGLTAFSFLGIGGLLALPVFALPVVLFGAPGQPGAGQCGAIIGAVGFVLFVGFRGRWSWPPTARCAWPGTPPSACATGCCAAATDQRVGRTACSSSGTSSAPCSASSGGRPRCSPPAGSCSTTSACCSPCGPSAPTRVRR